MRPVVCASFALMVCAWPASRNADAQVVYGSVVGTVSDGTGEALAGAHVTITNRETALTRRAVTNDSGGYAFTNVPPGPCDVKVTRDGFREFVKEAVPVGPNTVSRVDVTMELGELTEIVTVRSDASLLQTDKADAHTDVKSVEIVNLPLPNYRNYQSLMNLVPGASPATFQNSEVDTPGRSLRTFFNGQNPNSNTTRTDGATNINIGLPHHNLYVSPAETVDTVNVSTSSFDAEQGTAGGAVITVVTKSGTNDVKGSLFEFYNNQQLNARPYFQVGKTPSSAHIAGATIGGPVRRNQVFFFASWEGQYQRSITDAVYNVPPMALRIGDFSRAFNADDSLQVIYDPETGNADGTGRSPFPGNIIPADRISPIAGRIQELFPAPNTNTSSDATVGGAPVSRNFMKDERRVFNRNNYDLKLDWNRTSTHHVWAKYSRMDAYVSNLHKLGYEGGGDGDTSVALATLGTTWTMNSTTVFDVVTGLSRMDQEVIGADFALGNYGTDVLGVPGTNGGSFGKTDSRYAGMPHFETGFSPLGNNDTWMPVFRDERTTAVAANLTQLRGAHDVRIGYALNYLALDHWHMQLGGGPRGRLDFATGTTALKGGPQAGNFYNQYAAFLLGLVYQAQRVVQHEELTGREWQHAVYARDRWQLTPRLTLDLGLRYEYYPLMTRRDRGLETVDLDTLDVLLGGLGANATDLGIKVSKTLFAPRLGFVWRLNERMVFRTGYGTTYNPLPLSRALRGYYPLSITGNFVPLTTFAWSTTLTEGIPEVAAPDLSSGRIPLPHVADMRFPETDVSRGHIHSWNVAVERRLGWDIAADVAYVGTRGVDGFADLNINASDTPGGGVESQPYFERFGRRIPLLSWGPRLDTEYHSLQVALNRPFKNGLLLKGAYTFSKAMNMSDNDEDGVAGLRWNGASQLHRNWARAGHDRPHVFQMAVVFAVPYSLSSARNRVLGTLLGDWQVNGIFSAFSGTPFTVTADAAGVDAPGNLQTADQVGPYKELGAKGDAGLFFDTSSFAQPKGVRFGNSGRNAFRGPGQWNLDCSLFRGFSVGGRRRVELRAEFFNITNTPKWRNPLGTTAQDIGGTISVTNAGFGRNYNVAGERQIRFGLRFSF